jgi:hypothetical protein
MNDMFDYWCGWCMYSNQCAFRRDCMCLHSLRSVVNMNCVERGTHARVTISVCVFLLFEHMLSVQQTDIEFPAICTLWSRILIIIILSGVRLSPLGTVATTGLLYHLQMVIVEQLVEWNLAGNRSTGRKPASAPLCLPQIPHDQTRARTRAAAVGSRRLTSWAIARP